MPFSPFKQVGDFVFLSGQIGLKDKVLVSGGIKAETWQALVNMSKTLSLLGWGLENVVDVTIFLSDMTDFWEMNEAYSDAFKAPYPTRTCVGVKELPFGARIEIKAIAARLP